MRDAQPRTPRAVPVPRASRRRADMPRAGVTRKTEHTTYPRCSTFPARSRQRPLGPHRALAGAGRRSENRLRHQPKIRLAGSYIPRCQRRAPGFSHGDRLARGLPMGPTASRPRSRFSPADQAYPDAVHIRDLPDQPTSDARVASQQPRLDAGPTSQPMPICPPPRESRRTVLAPDAFRQPAALLEP